MAFLQHAKLVHCSAARLWKPAIQANSCRLLRQRTLQQFKGVGRCGPCSHTMTADASATSQAWVSDCQNSIVPAPSLVEVTNADVDPALPIYVTLGLESCVCDGSPACYEALKAGLKALKEIGVHGVVVEVWWGVVEAELPRHYQWDAYHSIFRILHELGLKAKAALCFHSTASVSLPDWVVRIGEEDPDIFFTDRNGNRRKECISLGIDVVPALDGRTAMEVYGDFMLAFGQEFYRYFGTTIVGAVIGLGPDGELKYPSQPRDAGWAFPGVGEFQCYDRFMLASLRACAQEVNQRSWGLGGPHDAGTYCQWPHQTGFFSHDGSWSSPYGSFFLQWYASALILHADRMMNCAVDIFSGADLCLSAKLPAVHWWYNHTCHAAEMTAGVNNSVHRDGYVPIMKCFQKWNVVAELPCADMLNHEQPDYALCNPEKLLLQQRAAAAALQVPVGLNNSTVRFDEAALSKLEYNAFSSLCFAGVDLPSADSITVHRVCNELFEPVNWHPFKAFLQRLKGRAGMLEDNGSSACGSIRLYSTPNLSNNLADAQAGCNIQKQVAHGSPVLV